MLFRSAGLVLALLCLSASVVRANPSNACASKGISEYRTDDDITAAIQCLRKSITAGSSDLNELELTIKEILGHLDTALKAGAAADAAREIFKVNGDPKVDERAKSKERVSREAFEAYDRGRKRLSELRLSRDIWSRQIPLLEDRLADLQKLSELLHDRQKYKK